MTPQTIDVQAVAIREPQQVTAADFLPVFTVEQAVAKKEMMNAFIGKVLKETKDGGEGDYGVMPGMNKKKVLLKPGAEKLCSIFGLAPQYTEDKIIEDWTGDEHGGEPLFYYSYRCQLSRGGRFMGEAIGSCNSWESKYRYRWIGHDLATLRPDFEQLTKRGGRKTIFEPTFAIDKAETTGKYGKPAEYWDRIRAAAEDGTAKRTKKKMGPKEYDGYEITIDELQYRIPNPEIADVINTCQKMAQKRALVAAVLVVTNCSDAFTQDVEDFADGHASDAVVDQPKAAAGSAPKSGRSIPEELAPIVARLNKEFTGANVTSAIRTMEDLLCDSHGTVAGVKEYERVTAAFRSMVPKGKEKLGDIVELLVDLWEAAQKPTSKPAFDPDKEIADGTTT